MQTMYASSKFSKSISLGLRALYFLHVIIFSKSPLPIITRSSRCWALFQNHSSGQSLTTGPTIWVNTPLPRTAGHSPKYIGRRSRMLENLTLEPELKLYATYLGFRFGYIGITGLDKDDLNLELGLGSYSCFQNDASRVSLLGSAECA